MKMSNNISKEMLGKSRPFRSGRVMGVPKTAVPSVNTSVLSVDPIINARRSRRIFRGR